MARYDYLCRRCGVIEVVLPMGSAAERRPCASCGAAARRVYTAPAAPRRDPALTTARETADRSAHEPAVVRGPPPALRRPAAAPNPLHLRLPRP
jgi:putative FmdB family regulatory protein